MKVSTTVAYLVVWMVDVKVGELEFLWVGMLVSLKAAMKVSRKVEN